MRPMFFQAPRAQLPFPRWFNRLPTLFAVGLGLLGIYLVVLATYGASPELTDVGYAPKQPIEYSHALHAGQLGIDCRYCHNTVERGAWAAIPPTQTCINCHANIRSQSPKLIPLRESYASGMPIRWERVHNLPDYVFFNHSAHVTRGVGCVSCHGRVDKMDVLHQVEPLSMGWCLDCHRQPEKHLRPRDKVTQMDWQPNQDQLEQGLRLRKRYNINPSTDCYTCHR